MRIHTSLNASELLAALPEGIHAYIAPKGSRKRAHAFEVTLFVFEKDELHRRYGNSGGYGRSNDVAATWDEWGIWMDRLYDLDPTAIIGWYATYADFMSVTTRERERHELQYKPESLAYRTHRAPWLDV